MVMVMVRFGEGGRTLLSTPEYMRAKVSDPTKGSVMILKARADIGSSSDDGRQVLVSPSSSVPPMASTSVGAGLRE